MRLSNNCILNFRNITIAVCFVLGTLNSAQAQNPDDNKIWTTVGSDGTVNETDVSKVFFDHSVVQMGRPLLIQTAGAKQKRTVILPRTQSAVIRYNVTPVDGLFTATEPCAPGRNCTGPQLTLRYLATGSGAQVVAKLIEVDLATGIETVRLNFKSNAFAASNGYQVKSGPIDCGPSWRFDFRRKAYYIEGTLSGSRLVVGSAAGIQIIKIDFGVCIN